MYWKYLIYLLRHKWFVFQECRKLSVTWLGIIHDLSKFSPTEFFRSARRYCGDGEPSEQIKQDYKLSWLHHQKHNAHHWIYWVVYIPMPGQMIYDEREMCIQMPERYAREMLADWRGSGRTFGKPDTRAWYRHQKDKMLLHPETRKWIERMLNLVIGPDGKLEDRERF